MVVTRGLGGGGIGVVLKKHSRFLLNKKNEIVMPVVFNNILYTSKLLRVDFKYTR
jgi:hypothetical protein